MLSRALNLSTPTLRVSTRVEAYSCKAISRERKLFRALESELIQDISHSTSVSPPEHHQSLLDSAFGPLDKAQSRKTLWLLIGLLNQRLFQIRDGIIELMGQFRSEWRRRYERE